MNKGRVEQFGQPFRLLQDEEGIFYEMVKHSGPKQSEELMRVAEFRFNRSAGNVGESALHVRDTTAMPQATTSKKQSCVPSTGLGNAAYSSESD